VEKEENITEELLDKALASKIFQDWLSRINSPLSDGLTFHKITIQSVDLFGPRVGFVKFVADAKNEAGKFVPGIVVLRGGSVCILLIFKCEDGEEYTIVTVQPRVPTSAFSFAEIPAGMIDDSHHFAGVAAKELQEECGLEIEDKDLIDLTAFAFKDRERGVYMTPGLCDEFMRIYAYPTSISLAKLREFEGKLTGNIEEGETISLKIVPFKELWQHCPDAKTLSALYLWQKYQSSQSN